MDKPGEVKAKDIEADQDLEILEPDAHIATVSEGGELHMELRIKNGRGYVPAEKNFDEDLGIGWIPLDSVHSPVKKVNYIVEAARVGQATDYDKLISRCGPTGRSPRQTPCRKRPRRSSAT